MHAPVVPLDAMELGCKVLEFGAVLVEPCLTLRSEPQCPVCEMSASALADRDCKGASRCVEQAHSRYLCMCHDTWVCVTILDST
jgi:hypothetical protein